MLLKGHSGDFTLYLELGDSQEMAFYKIVQNDGSEAEMF